MANPVLNENGESILVPKLYLSKLTGKKIYADGSIISASNLDVKVQGNIKRASTEEEKKEIDQDITNSIISANKNGLLKLSDFEDNLLNNLTEEQKEELKDFKDTRLETAQKDFDDAVEDKITELNEQIEKLREDEYNNTDKIREKLTEIITELRVIKFDSDNFKKLVEKTYIASLNARGKFVNSGTFRASGGFAVDAGDINNYNIFQSGQGGISLKARRDINIESQYAELSVKNDFFGEQIYGSINSQAKVTTTGNLILQAGRDLNIVGVDVNVGLEWVFLDR